MNISGIDKDLVDIINYLDAKGFKPFASCDGVLANHTDSKSVTSAYIAFLKSPKIIDLMSAFLRDKNNFQVFLSSDSYVKPLELYGNILEGNRYTVSFSNEKGDVTSYLERIIKGIAEGTIAIPDGEKKNLRELSETLEDDENSDLYFEVTLNCSYQPFMQKQGKVNVMKVGTKEGYGYARNMSDLADILAKKYEMPKKKADIMDFNQDFSESEFVLNHCGNDMCEIYFSDERLEQMIREIRFIRGISPTLPTFEVKEPDYDEFDFYEDEYIN